MFTVHGKCKADCLGCKRDKECLVVSCKKGTVNGPLCLKCFDRQLDMRIAAERAGGEPSAATLAG
jgi:hypothetical protein